VARVVRLGPWIRMAALLVKPPLLLCTRRDWRGQENVPPTGGVILAPNHISHADPLIFADYVIYGVHRVPRFMAKSSLFQGNGIVARTMRGAHQIPVYRRTADASLALRDAVTALQQGECVIIYPEGTVTRDPDKWPMQGKTGVARLALLSGAPVIPIGQWGPEKVLDSYRRRGIRLLPPTRIQVTAGAPVDLSAYRDRELTADVLRDATAEVMRAITRLVEELRGEPAPATVHVHEPRIGRATEHRRSA
jgi:1-acyl-sn-glycerol-3-phosphate acyltransferase